MPAKALLTIAGLGVSFCAALFPGSAFARDFSEKQLWECSGRPGETGKILINKVEQNPKLGPIFHISVSGIRIKSPASPTGFSETIAHLPVSQSTLDGSCKKLLGTAEINPEYLEGYKIWRQAFDEGKAGVFTIPMSEIIVVIEKLLDK